MSGTPNRSRTPGNQNFHVFGAFWSGSVIFDENEVIWGEKFSISQKKFPKVTHLPGIPSKGQPQAPRELGDIQNLAKGFFVLYKRPFP